MANTKAIVTGVYPLVENSLKTNLNKYKQNIGKFINARHNELYDIAPFTRIYWTVEDTNDFYSCMKFTEDDVMTHINKTYYANIAAFNPRCAKDPFTCAQLMVIRYFYLKKMKKELELSMIYLAFSGSFYPSIHYGSFPKVQPSEYRHVMEYVVNNELSMKFDLKREGNVIGAIRSIANTWLDSYGNKLKTCSDEDVVYLLQQLHNRIKSFMKNIADLYYKIYSNKDVYLAYDSDNYTEDNFRETDNDSLKAERYTMTAMTYITTHTVNYKFCKMASDSNIKTDEIKSIIETIQMDNTNLVLIKEFMNILIVEYLKNSKDKSVSGIDFINASIAAKPNSKNPNIIREKEIIEKLLDENSTQYRKRKSREATKNSYHRALIAYYTLIINQSNK